MACVNVTAGILTLEVKDLALPGFIPFSIVRSYRSSSDVDGLLGEGWGLSLGEWIERHGDEMVLQNAEGRSVRFPIPTDEGAEENRVEALRLEMEVREVGGRTVWVFTVRSAAGWRRFRQVDGSHRFPLSTMGDIHGNTIRFDYKGGVLQKVRDTLDRELRLEHDTRGRLTRILLERKEETTTLVEYEYGADERLAEVRKLNGATNRYFYQDGLLVHHTDDRGIEHFNAYDGERRCVRSWRKGGYYARVFRYDHQRFQTLAIDSRGAGTVYRFSEFNLVTEVVNALGGISSFQYDDGNNIILAVNQVGSATFMEFGEHGRTTAIVRANGATETLEYDDAGFLLKRTLPNGGSYEADYDEVGNLVEVRSPEGRPTVFEYDRRGGTTAMVFANGERLEREYDAYHIRFSHGGGPVLERTFDPIGRLTSLTYGGRHRIEYRRDDQGRLVEEVGIGGSLRRFAYDDGGRLLAVRDERHAHLRFEYNEVGLRTATEKEGARTEFEYDTEGRLIQVRNSRGEVHEIRHDLLGRMIQQRFFDGRVERYEHDAAGAITRVRNGDGGEITYTPDPLGRPVLIEHSGGTVVEYEYDPMGRVVFARRDEVELGFTYDLEGQVVQQRQDDFELEYEYDEMGKLARAIDSDGRTVDWKRNNLGEPTAFVVTPPQVDEKPSDRWTVELEHDDVGGVSRLESSDGIRIARRNNPWGRAEWQRVSLADSVILEERIAFDRAGLVVERKNEELGTVSFEYDSGGNLTSVSKDDNVVERYTYDEEFNLVSKTVTHPSGSERTDLAYGHGNRLESAGERKYQYDDSGRLASIKDGDRYTRFYYSDDDLLVRAESADGSVTEFEYDALRRRTRKSTAGITTRFYWDEFVLWAEKRHERSTTGKQGVELWARRYVFDPSDWALLGIEVADGRHVAVSDQIGAPKALIDQRGSVSWAFAGTAWGEPFGTLSSDRSNYCPIRFPGQYADAETGLHYNLNRYYDPTVGRYTTPDPIGLLGGINLYAYPPDPLNYKDPLGLECENFPQGEPSNLFRGDHRSPSEICPNGFQPRNPTADISIKDHAGGKTRGWVSTSYDMETAEFFAQGNPPGYVYMINNPACAENPGHEVDCDPEVQERQEWLLKETGEAEASEFEIAFKNVPPDAVVGYFELTPSGALGDFKAC